MEEEKEKNLDFDTILENYVGGGGKWQWSKIFWLAPGHIAFGIPVLLHIFAAYTPPHRCFINGCDSNVNPAFEASFLDYSTPRDHASSTFLRDREDFDPCQSYSKIRSTCSARSFDQKTRQNCSKYVYDHSEFSETLTTKFDLVCDKVNQRHSLGSIMMVGLLTGSLLGGPLSDKIGRKNTILLAVIIVVPCLIGGGYAKDFATYAILRYISCTVIVFGWIGSHSIRLEYISRNKRALIMALDGTASYFLNLTLPLIGKLSH